MILCSNNPLSSWFLIDHPNTANGADLATVTPNNANLIHLLLLAHSNEVRYTESQKVLILERLEEILEAGADLSLIAIDSKGRPITTLECWDSRMPEAVLERLIGTLP